MEGDGILLRPFQRDPARFLIQVGLSILLGCFLGGLAAALGSKIKGFPDSSFWPTWGLWGGMLTSLLLGQPFAERLDRAFSETDRRRQRLPWLAAAIVVALLIFLASKRIEGASVIAEFLPFEFLVMTGAFWLEVARVRKKAARNNPTGN